MFTRIGFITTLLLAQSSTAFGLSCGEVRELTKVYFKMHFSFHSFDDELSKRTLDAFIKSWDPGKVYFLQADVDGFTSKYDTKLDDMLAKSDCKAIDEVVNLYSKRFEERQAQVMRLIDENYDFTKDDYMEIDRKKMNYPATTEEVLDRWRKRIKFQMLQLKSTLNNDMAKMRDKLKKRYALATKRHNELTSDDVYAVFLNSFSSSLDPHSEYYNPEQLEDFRIQTRLSLEGIGAVLRSEDGFTTIQSLVPGGAAWNSGKLKVDDKIIAVAQGAEPPVDVVDMDLREVVKLIRGARGTEVRLSIVRDGKDTTEKLVVPVIREQVQLQDRAAKSYVYNVRVDENKTPRDYKVGMIVLPSFYMDFEGRQNREKGFTSSSADVRRELANLKKEKVDLVMVDLRNNGGGALDESINIGGLFFDKGPVVQIKAMDGTRYVQEDKDNATVYDGPLMLMINRQSASASEILAGAIQDYERGLVVGDSHTFGKGTVQNLNDIDEKLGAVKVTISKFYRPSGSSTQLKGVESDVVLASISDEYEIGEKYYDHALPWEEIQAAKYKQFGMVKPYVAQLKTASANRTAQDEGFKKLAKDIEEYRKNAEERSRVSLKEKAEDKAKPGETAKPAAEEEEQDDGSGEPDLVKDYHLQESLRIAGDYLQLLNKRALGAIELVDLKKANVADKSKAQPGSVTAGNADKKVVGEQKQELQPNTAAPAPNSAPNNVP
jgi:carboxyl-terminal processing protease